MYQISGCDGQVLNLKGDKENEWIESEEGGNHRGRHVKKQEEEKTDTSPI